MKKFKFEEQEVAVFFERKLKKLCLIIPFGWDGIKLQRFKETYKTELIEFKTKQLEKCNAKHDEEILSEITL